MADIQLSEKPTLHPDCCCPISMPLIRSLSSSLSSNPDFIMSIGSGSGLLEALLLRESHHLNVHAVEVSEGINKYLPEERMQLVHGTWDLASSAKDAAAWLFVYPRDYGLLRKYIQVYGEGSVGQIIWIGPLADYKDAEAVLLKQGWVKGAVAHIGHGSVMLQSIYANNP